MKRGIGRYLLALAAPTILLSSPARAADPTTDECLTASDASLKSEDERLLRAERAQLVVCSAASCPGDVRAECVRRAAQLDATIPTLTFEAKDADGAPRLDVKVTIDREVLTERLGAGALSVDPGPHVFTFETAGQPAVKKQFVIRELEKDRREMIVFGTPDGAGPATPAAPSTRAPALPNAVSPEPGGALGPQQILALATGGLGVVGLGVGSAFGLVAMSKKSDAQNVCPHVCTDQAGATKWRDAKSAGNLSTVAFIVGGAALAGAAVLWLTAKTEANEAPRAQVGLGLSGVQLKATW